MVAMALNPPVKGALAVVTSLIHASERIRFFSGKPDRRLLDQVAAEFAAGHLRPVIDRVYRLDQLAEAHRAAEAGGRCGKQVIDITDGQG